MTISDYMIIYLSAGAPFAVLAFLQMPDAPIVRRIVTAAAVMLAWPAAAAIWMVRRFRGLEHPFGFELVDKSRDGKIHGIANSLERSVLSNGSVVSLYEWREIYERYTGLSLAVAEADGNSEDNELFEVAGNKNGKLGTVCLNRRNRNRLIFHHTQARNDFLDALIRAKCDGDALGLALELAALLDDADAAADLKSMRGPLEQNPGRTPVIDMEQDIWNPPTPKPHIANRI